MNAGRFSVENYRGRLVPRTLGLWLLAVMIVATIADALRSGGTDRAAAGLLGGSALVFAAGLVDDLVPGQPRGLKNHLRQLADGRLTTGAVKLLVAVGASVVTIALQGTFSASTRVAGVVMVAGATNVWNGLDVRPGRALKAFLVVGIASAAALPWTASVMPALLGLVVVGAPVALALDLRERAMLGDSGATMLGFVAGVSLFHALPKIGVFAGAVVVAGLNVLADRPGFSRMIEIVPPLRWVDRLGRRPESNGSADQPGLS